MRARASLALLLASEGFASPAAARASRLPFGRLYVVALKPQMEIIILVLAFWGRFPANLGPGTRSNGSGSTNGVERSYK